MRIIEHGHTVIGTTVFFVCLQDGSIAAVAAEQRLTAVSCCGRGRTTDRSTGG